MTPAAIIRQATAGGVILALSPSGTIRATGGEAAVNQWLPLIRQHKAELLAELSAGAAGGPVPLKAEHEAAIRRWLAHIEETDHALIAHCLEQCRSDPEALAYFLRQAGDVHRDDRRSCPQCANLTAGGACLSVRRGEITQGPAYPPLRDHPQRCAGYMPKAGDPDQRPGYERWPGLAPQFTQRKAAA